MSLQDLKRNPMLKHLIDALDAGRDIGHYGRLTLAMVARHFLSDEELTELLAKDPSIDQQAAAGLVHQVQSADYNPPKADKIRHWDSQQDFPLLPDGLDIDDANVYQDLTFPEHVYESIGEYHEHKAETHS